MRIFEIEREEEIFLPQYVLRTHYNTILVPNLLL